MRFVMQTKPLPKKFTRGEAITTADIDCALRGLPACGFEIAPGIQCRLYQGHQDGYHWGCDYDGTMTAFSTPEPVERR